MHPVATITRKKAQPYGLQEEGPVRQRSNSCPDVHSNLQELCDRGKLREINTVDFDRPLSAECSLKSSPNRLSHKLFDQKYVERISAIPITSPRMQSATNIRTAESPPSPLMILRSSSNPASHSFPALSRKKLGQLFAAAKRKEGSTDQEDTSRKTLAPIRVLNPLFAPRAELMKLLASRKFQVLSILCDTVEIWNYDELAAAVLMLFGVGRNVEQLMQWAIKTEIKNSGSEDLFRGNGMRQTLISQYISKTGNNFLKQVVKPHIRSICQSELSMELDPDKLQPGDDLMANQERLKHACTLLLNDLLGSIDVFPSSLKRIFHFTHTQLVRDGPSWYNVLASLFFLRFFCPSFVSPESYGLVSDAIPSGTRRRLILVSKLVQIISNSAGNIDSFSLEDKEHFMRPFASFIAGYKGLMINFFDQLTQINNEQVYHDPKDDQAWLVDLKEVPKNNGTLDPVECINKYILFYQDKLQKELQNNSQRFKRYSRGLAQIDDDIKLQLLNQEIARLKSFQRMTGSRNNFSLSPKGQFYASSNSTPNQSSVTTPTCSCTASPRYSGSFSAGFSSVPSYQFLFSSTGEYVNSLELQVRLLSLQLEAEKLLNRSLSHQYNELLEDYSNLQVQYRLVTTCNKK